MEIHQLEYFLAIDKYGSFSKAALELCVSQSSISQQIQKLEAEMGTRLFIREPRKVRLSPAGEEFRHYAQKIITDLEHCADAMQQFKQCAADRIRIGAIATMAYLGFDRIIKDFLERYPAVSAEVEEGTTDDLIHWLRESRIDAAFISAPTTNEQSVSFHPLVNDEVVALLPARHALANKPSIQLKDLADEKFLLAKSSTGFKRDMVQACHESGFNPNVILNSNHEILRHFVEEEMGVSLMGRRIARLLCSPNTAIVSIHPPLKRVSGLAIPSKRTISPTVKRFRDFVINYKPRSKR
ncbi:putative HTH-type transcriptional regulator YcgK [Alicyclobacillus acidoterrestris]|uniref:LysR family transcriptional regulator n=1 Tax=Alicyclobacillus suci TaxID=2816080 RepID=UPI0011950A3A|nr:LysR family transcriptional regulator [Alicyclobacillus suci]GEO25496.1 putative HTH-type transcriptional regulator YcgK [Alicyclobacillus acidoterrestris]